MTEALLDVVGLKKYFPIRGGIWRHQIGAVKAVDGVDLNVGRGETVAIVGESGCGKSTTGRAIMNLDRPTAGEVIFHHPKLGAVNLGNADPKTLKAVRPHLQMIFQDPFASLDARMTVGSVISEPLEINKVASGRQLKDRVAELLTLVGLRPEHASRYPHAFSGGQRQRIGIARAIALNPDLIVCDEAVSALDVSVQAQVLNLLDELQQKLDLAYLFISHDLSVIEHISDRVSVMYVGRVVETGNVEDIFAQPKHPYTEALLAAVPQPDPRVRRKGRVAGGDVPNPANPPSGCYFHPRCPYAQPICAQEYPPIQDLGNGRTAACHFADKLNLTGALGAKAVAAQQDAAGPIRRAVAPQDEAAVPKQDDAASRPESPASQEESGPAQQESGRVDG